MRSGIEILSVCLLLYIGSLSGQEVLTSSQPDTVSPTATEPYSQSFLSGEEIKISPQRQLSGFLQFLPGVSIQDGLPHVRGGEDFETGYYLNGAPVNDMYRGRQGIYIIPAAIQQMRLLPGGYPARYGQAQAGILLTEMLTGTADYRFTVDYQTDKFADSGEKFFDTYTYQDHILTAVTSGPIYDDRFRFFITAENERFGDAVKRFSSAFKFDNLIDVNPENPDSWFNPDTVSLVYPSGFTPKNSSNRWALNTNFTLDLDPFFIRITGIYNWRKWYDVSNPMRQILNDRQQYWKNNIWYFSGQLNHQLSADLSYDLGISYYQNDQELFDDYFENEWRLWADSAAISRYTNNDVEYYRNFRDVYNYQLGGITFFRNGFLNNDYTIENQNSFTVNGNISYCLNQTHHLHAGISWRTLKLRRYEVDPRVLQNLRYYGQQDSIPNIRMAEYTGYIYGYDYWGNTIESGFYAPKKPSFATVYLEDKIRLKKWYVNLGLRWDYYDLDMRYLRNPENLTIYDKEELIKEENWANRQTFTTVSPRLAASCLISPSAVVFGNFGVFTQTQPLAALYNRSGLPQNPRIPVDARVPLFLEYKTSETAAHEFGMRYRLSSSLTGEADLYWRNSLYKSFESGTDEPQRVTTNANGLDISLLLQPAGRFSARFFYSYLNTEIDLGDNKFPLEFEHTHSGTALMSYIFATGNGGPVLQNSSATVVFRFKSGHPYIEANPWLPASLDPYYPGIDYLIDMRSRQPLDNPRSFETAWNFQFDLYLKKSFAVYDRIQATAFIRVLNVLNAKNEINVYNATGSTTDDGYANNPEYTELYVNAYGQTYLDLYRALNLQNSQSYWEFLGKQMYGQPRQILMGVRIEY
jgi:hypothetical protein